VSLAPGTRVGPYEVIEAIGAGGMSEVYRARDPRLARDVAIKILASELGSSAERLRRFEVEARAVGMLSHPNVLAVFDVGSHDGAPYLVTELLVGETLQGRLARGPLPVRRALEIAIPVAHALAAAHEKGIVHRDLKPGNVFLTSGGVVKVLDFGLAKLLRPDLSGSGDGDREPLTRSDLIVGTAGYMSPEQVRGQPTDARSDLFALGAILLEMLSGRRAFQRDSAVETMNAILTEEPPDLAPLASSLPPGLVGIVTRCLEKKKESRFQSARDLAFALESLSAVTAPSAPARPARPRAPRWVVPGSVALAALLLAGLALAPRLRATRAVESPRLRLMTHSGADGSPAVSPDGRTLVYVSRRDGAARLFLQQPAAGLEIPLTAGPGDLSPRFFPDGGFVLFTHADAAGHTSLDKISVLGGEPRRLVDDAADGDVSPDGQRLAFLRRAPGEDTGFQLIVASASGDSVQPLAHFGSFVLAPRFSPDGETIAVTEPGGPQSEIPGAIALVRRDGNVERIPSPIPFRSLTSAAWNGDGRSFFFGVLDAGLVHTTSPGGRLYRQPIGGGAPEALHWWPSLGTCIDVAGDGRILLDSTSVRENLQLVELGGKGGPPRWLTRGAGSNRQPVYSPDGEWILFSSDWSSSLDLWSLSTRGGALRRVTDDPADDWDPAFSADGKRILWSSKRSGHFEIWSAAPDGSDARRLTDDGVDAENPAATPDGKSIVYGSFNPKSQGIWKASVDGTGPALLIPGSLHQIPEVSPDGRYVLCRHGLLHGPRSVRVFSLATGALAGEITFGVRDAAGSECGRARWLPDGRIAFLGLDEKGVTGVYGQDFVEGRDTTASRKALAGFDPSAPIQSFGISPDGRALVVSAREGFAHVLMAEPVAGVVRRRVE